MLWRGGQLTGVDPNYTPEKNSEYEKVNEGTHAADVYVSQGSTYTVTLPKTIVLDGTADTSKKNYDGEYSIKAEGNISGDQIVRVVPLSDTMTLKQKNKNDIEATINQERVQFTSDEVMAGTSFNGTIETKDLSAGSWSGQTVFGISLRDIKFIAHRGYMGLYPENSLVGIQAAAKDGFDMVEVDVVMTADNVPVVYHSSSDDMSINRIARNTDGSKIADTININEATYNDLLQYDFGIYKGQKFAGTKIATFEQALTAAKEAGINVYIDFHNTDFTTEQMQKILNIIDSTGNKGNVEYGDVSINDVAKNTDGTKMIKDFDPDATFYMALYGPNYYNNVLGRCKRNNISLNNVVWVASMNELKNEESTAGKIIKDHKLKNLGLYSIDDNATLKLALKYGSLSVSTDYSIDNLYK